MAARREESRLVVNPSSSASKHIQKHLGRNHVDAGFVDLAQFRGERLFNVPGYLLPSPFPVLWELIRFVGDYY